MNDLARARHHLVETVRGFDPGDRTQLDVNNALASLETAVRADERAKAQGSGDKWEKVLGGCGALAGEDLCRIRVPGGWLYRDRQWSENGEATALQFVAGGES